MTGVALERFEPTGVRVVDESVLYWGRANLCPVAYRIGQRDDGATDWPNLVIASASLYALDANPIRNLPDTYVVHGRFGMMAALQTAFAQREGVDLQIVEVDDQHATVRILLPGERRGDGQLFTVTMAEAVRAGWAGRNPCYRTMPQKMLPARAVTAAINARAPGVLRGIALRVGGVAPLDLDGLGSGAISAGVGTPPATLAPAPAEYLTRAAPDDLRLEVLERLERLRQVDPAAHLELRAEWKRLRGPVVQVAPGAPQLAYLPDVLVLRYMLDEIEGALEVPSGGAAHEGGPTPPDVYDAAPESRDMEPDEPDYGADDPRRPF